MIAAILDVKFSSHSENVHYNCKECHKNVRKLRRCDEDREFTSEDAAFWPIVLNGNQYGFCPGKATRDPVAMSYFNFLTVVAETGSMWCSGGISEQPQWFIDLASWFLSCYSDLQFASRMRMLFGSGESNNGSQQGKLGNQNHGR
jgi:hypothetical protein